MDVIDKLVSIEEQIAGLHAQQLRLIASLRDPITDFKGFARDEVAAALRWSDGTARERFHIAAETTLYFPELLDALDDGQVTFGHVASFCELTAHLDEDTAALVMENVLDYAQTHSIADFRRKVKRELLKADPVVAEYAYEQALQDRRVWSAPAEPGMATVGAVLPAEGAATLMAALAFLTSQPEPDDDRSKDQRMADALVRLGRDVLAGGCSHCGLPARVVGPSVTVTVALSTLLDLDQQGGDLNGEAIPAELARALAADETGTWRRLVTDEVGHLVDYGRSTYRVPTPLREHIVIRWDLCVFPGCRRRAVNADIDHVTPWSEGGETNVENCVPLCARHHHLKHEAAGWQLKLLPDAVEWTDPNGRTYHVQPHTYPLDQTSRSIVRLTDNLNPAAARADDDRTIEDSDQSRPSRRDHS
jgi:hypothetical protein